MTKLTTSQNKINRNRALELILLMGLVSALGDVTYETGRSVSGPYLALLGASAVTIGVVSGLGEFLGYALRLVSGYLASRTRSYWLATFIGYGLILAIPFLAFTNRWEWAVVCLLLERIGKAVRSPARDTILSYATSQVGRGWGFALHEALDQLGAVIGPLLFAVAFAARNSYQDGFNILWIPAVLTILMLGVAFWRVPQPQRLEETSPDPGQAQEGKKTLPRIFWIYGAFTFLGVAGFANFQVISYHWVSQSVVPETQIPVLYAVAMGVDIIAALVVGKTYDRIGLKSLAIIPFVTLPLPFLAFSTRYGLAIGAAVLWGIIMAVHETVMRAAIADLVPGERRAFAYGIFNTIYGAAWFVSGAALGLLYEVSIPALILYVVIFEIAALWVFSRIYRPSAKAAFD